MKLFQKFIPSYTTYVGVILLNYFLVTLFRFWELIMMGAPGSATDILNGLPADILVVSVVLLVLYIPFYGIALWGKRKALWIAGSLSILFYTLAAPVQALFISSSRLLPDEGSANCLVCEAYFSVFNELDFFAWLLPMGATLLLGAGFLYWLLKHNIEFSPWLGKFLLVFQIIAVPVVIELDMNTAFLDKNKYRISKPFYFAKTGFVCFTGIGEKKLPELEGFNLFHSLQENQDFVLPREYPLVREREKSNCFGDFLEDTVKSRKPDIVLLLVEGLGERFLHPVKGISFMPFLNELSRNGLYWEHFLSTSERQQNAIPSLTAGLPYADNGFTNQPILPHHFSLFNVLKHNQYHTAYYTGQWTWFQSTDKYLEFNNVDVVMDADDFPDTFEKVLYGEDDYFWGYNDNALMNIYHENRKLRSASPRFDMIHTGSLRDPFAIDNDDYYQQRFKELIADVSSETDKAWFVERQRYFMAMMFTDDVLKAFFNRYAQDTSYQNTIFILTGTSPIPELTHEGPLDKYHVPMLIYSPMQKEPVIFSAVKSQNDLYESVAGFLEEDYSLDIPAYSTSLGFTLCKEEELSGSFVPFLDRQGNISEIYYNGHFLSADKQLFRKSEGLIMEPVSDEKTTDQLSAILNAFKEVNASASRSLLPDSIFFGFFEYDILKDTVFTGQRVRKEYRNIIENMAIESGVHYVDIQLFNPDVVLDEVFLVFELRDAEDNLLQWKNYGIPTEKKDFSIRIVLEDHFTERSTTYLQLFLWNESPVPYSFEKARVLIYRKNGNTYHE